MTIALPYHGIALCCSLASEPDAVGGVPPGTLFTLGSSKMVKAWAERRRVKQVRSLEERLAEQAAKLKEQAAILPAGVEREARLVRH